MGAILALLPSLIDLAKKYIPDRAAQDQAIAEINQAVNDAATKAGEAMIEDAKSSDKFQSRWRPAIGWICAIGVGMHFIVFPVVSTIFSAFGLHGVVSPLDIDGLMAMVMTLLGMGGLRTVEKIKR